MNFLSVRISIKTLTAIKIDKYPPIQQKYDLLLYMIQQKYDLLLSMMITGLLFL